MFWAWKPIALAITVAGWLSLPVQTACGADLYKPFRAIKLSLEPLHRDRPVTGKDDGIEQLAREIDWLEHHIDKYGTIVAKHPDIWGQSRLMRHRYEYEQQMATMLDQFEVRMNGALRRSDQAFLGMAFALQAAAGNQPGGTTPVKVPSVEDANSQLAIVSNLVSDPNAAPSQGQVAVIDRSAPPTKIPNGVLGGFAYEQDKLSLEPTIQLDQMSRYLNHLQELRRINEGDDIADSPGYSLNLVRIPVSVLPGKQTRKGYGAEITITATPYLSRELLPMTYRNLVVEDVVDLLAPVITHLLNDSKVQESARGKQAAFESTFQPKAVPDTTSAPSSETSPSPKHDLTKAVGIAVSNAPPRTEWIPSGKTRRARMPLPPSQFVAILGNEQLATIVYDAYQRLGKNPVNQPVIHYMDVRGHLAAEIQAAYDFLSQQNCLPLWDTYAGPVLATAIRENRVRTVESLREQFFKEIGDLAKHDEYELAFSPPLPATGGEKEQQSIKVTAALAWAVIVESSLLNVRLNEDIQETVTAKGCPCVPPQGLAFYGPNPLDDARTAFVEYVKCRWPVRVFALDPVTQDQNIADAFARRRELQVALAIAFASGRMNAQALMRFTRRLEWDMATIDLNRTAVGFSHGNDTFGWRFHPRFQTPPIKGNIAAFGETLFGGPTEECDLNERELEPGPRECTAIIVMPSFVPYVTFDVRSNWFKLTNPKITELSMEDTMVLSRSVKAMQQSAAACAQCAHLYRDGEVERMLRRVDQLDHELPLQTMQAQIPYENTSGGFEMFNTGITDLEPELIGWYGAPGINPKAPTTMFLIGKGFSVHDTQILAGGRVVPFNLISRQVVQVEIPNDIQVLPRSSDEKDRYDEVVDVHMATPYGVTSHLLVPLAKVGALASVGATELQIRPEAHFTLSFTVMFANDKVSGTPLDNYFGYNQDAIVIRCPQVFSPPDKPTLNFQIVEAGTGTYIGPFSVANVPFNGRDWEYYLTGSSLRSMVCAQDGSLNKALESYLCWRGQNDKLPQKGNAVEFILTGATLSKSDGSLVVPVKGDIAVTARRRN